MSDDTNSRRLGSILGPTLVVVTLSEYINLSIWSENIPQVTYLNGMILFAAGLAIVRFHSRWRPLWTLSITLVGWLLIAGGLFRLFFPSAPQADPGLVGYGFVALLGALGVLITIKSYMK